MSTYSGAGWGIPSNDPAERDGREIKSQVPKSKALKPNDGKTYDNAAGSTKVAQPYVGGNNAGAAEQPR